MPKNRKTLIQTRLKELARLNMASNRATWDFDFVVSCIESELDADDKKLVNMFRAAKLNVSDPVHWWQLLHEVVMALENRPSGAPKIWTKDKLTKLKNDCIRVGRRQPATNSIKEISRRLKDDLHYKQTPENLQFIVTRSKWTGFIKERITPGLSSVR